MSEKKKELSDLLTEAYKLADDLHKEGNASFQRVKGLIKQSISAFDFKGSQSLVAGLKSEIRAASPAERAKRFSTKPPPPIYKVKKSAAAAENVQPVDQQEEEDNLKEKGLVPPVAAMAAGKIKPPKEAEKNSDENAEEKPEPEETPEDKKPAKVVTAKKGKKAKAKKTTEETTEAGKKVIEAATNSGAVTEENVSKELLSKIAEMEVPQIVELYGDALWSLITTLKIGGVSVTSSRLQKAAALRLTAKKLTEDAK